jgi:colanic acid/amylovoran biosynthesis glycosyltransferase
VKQINILYITERFPWGAGEQFIGPEITRLIEQGYNIKIYPVRLDNKILKGEEKVRLSKQSIWIQTLSPKTLIYGTVIGLLNPIKLYKLLYKIVIKSNSLKHIIQNILILPKGLVISKKVKGDFAHIHSHWATVPTSLAYIISEWSNIPFSFTTHRWDITENNMLAEKVKKAKFVRAINHNGKKEINVLVENEDQNKIKVIHVGVKINKINIINKKTKKKGPLIELALVGRMIPVKGHKYLIEACKLLKEKNIKFRCLFIGDGPLKKELQQIIQNYGLEKDILLLGELPHEELLTKYKNKEIDIVILPSIVTNEGVKEGIPVSLMEAMAAGIPTISTYTGGIPELLGDESGILVPAEDSYALAKSIENLIFDINLRSDIAEKGKTKVFKDFFINNVVEKLLREITR